MGGEEHKDDPDSSFPRPDDKPSSQTDPYEKPSDDDDPPDSEGGFGLHRGCAANQPIFIDMFRFQETFQIINL